MRLEVTVGEPEIKAILLGHIRDKLGDVSIKAEDITVEVKSKQNYRSEWEPAQFRATLVRNGA